MRPLREPQDCGAKIATLLSDSHADMKRLLAFAAACSLALICVACAGTGPAPSSDASGITMYGTIDEGIVVRH